MPDRPTARTGTPRLGLGRGGLTLTVETEAAAAQFIEGRSDAIAAHLGISRNFVRGCYAKNPAYWEHLEGRWMRQAFGPLAPRHLAEQQEREDRRALWDTHRAALREAWAKGGGPREDAASGPGDGPRPPAPLWQRLTVGLVDFLRHLTGAALVLLALFFGAVWLAHHAGAPPFGLPAF